VWKRSVGKEAGFAVCAVSSFAYTSFVRGHLSSFDRGRVERRRRKGGVAGRRRVGGVKDGGSGRRAPLSGSR